MEGNLMQRALNAEELYEAFSRAAQDAVNCGDGAERKQLNIAADNLDSFAMGYLATALLEMGIGVER
jgi:hypothetical protein